MRIIEPFYLLHDDHRWHVDHQAPPVRAQIQDHHAPVRETDPELVLALVQLDHVEGLVRGCPRPARTLSKSSVDVRGL